VTGFYIFIITPGKTRRDSSSWV